MFTLGNPGSDTFIDELIGFIPPRSKYSDVLCLVKVLVALLCNIPSYEDATLILVPSSIFVTDVCVA